MSECCSGKPVETPCGASKAAGSSETGACPLTRFSRMIPNCLEFAQAAKAAGKDNIKGMRTVTKWAVEDHRSALHWIAANDRDAVTAFIEAYVQKHHKDKPIAGVNVWTEKQAF
mgnify:CR=1 FL=1